MGFVDRDLSFELWEIFCYETITELFSICTQKIKRFNSIIKSSVVDSEKVRILICLRFDQRAPLMG